VSVEIATPQPRERDGGDEQQRAAGLAAQGFPDGPKDLGSTARPPG
jgi:hypothetical protein